MFCAVVPQRTEWEPHASFPIIPPTVHRSCVDGSGPTRRPWRAAATFTSSSTVPGRTVAVIPTGSKSRIPAMWRETSRTRPVPIALPAMLVPAPRIVTGTPDSAAIARAAAMSSASTGATTAVGRTR